MRAFRLFGSCRVKLALLMVISRSTPATLAPAFAKASRTESSSPNSRNAASTETSVKPVRAGRRNSAAPDQVQVFHDNVAAPADQRALVEVHGVTRVVGGLRIVRRP